MFNLASTATFPCGNTNSTPLHFATECILTASFHMTKPAQQHELIRFRNVASNKGSRLKFQRLRYNLNEFQELFANHSMINFLFKPFPLSASRQWGIFEPSSSKRQRS
ncbi:hypothetical protein AVEN_237656-1 [Araneus ventricosus]|uniref:Uncharacterized protein n=1 Tax=Araneus ventricosus TaxID=182803 RepID=A0A4Y2KDS7_ARAVE|nr:hypothetical protein AVEN_237656-1 [Araneus ventricosus]